MDSQRWRRLEALFAAATELEPDERGPWLEAQCGDDSAMLRDLRLLLDADHRASDGHFIVDAIELAVREFRQASVLRKNEERRTQNEG